MVEHVKSVSDILLEALDEANELSTRDSTRVDDITGCAPYFQANFQAFLDALTAEGATESDYDKVASELYDMTQRDNIFLEQFNWSRYQFEAMVWGMDLRVEANRRAAIFMLEQQIQKEQEAIDSVWDVDEQVSDILKD